MRAEIKMNISFKKYIKIWTTLTLEFGSIERDHKKRKVTTELSTQFYEISIDQRWETISYGRGNLRIKTTNILESHECFKYGGTVVVDHFRVLNYVKYAKKSKHDLVGNKVWLYLCIKYAKEKWAQIIVVFLINTGYKILFLLLPEKVTGYLESNVRNVYFKEVIINLTRTS